MLLAVALGLIVFLFPLWGFLAPRLRTQVFATPLLLLLHTFTLGSLACLGYGRIAYGWGSLVFYTLAASFVAWGLLLRFLPRRAQSRGLAGRLPWFLLLTGFLIFDIVLIYFRQGWGFADGSLLEHAQTYFRAPFHSDNFRNLFLIEALARGDGSPFLAGSKLVYQLFWFHLVAPLVVPLQNVLHLPTAFQIVQGVSLAFNFAAYLSLLLTFFQVRPSLFRGVSGVFILFVLFSHADILSPIFSLWETGSVGLEADWSYSPAYFRNFTLKLLGVPSPQHLYFIWALAVLWLTYRWPVRPLRLALRLFVAALAVVISPSMGALLLPCVALADVAPVGRGRHALIRLGYWIAAAVVGLVGYGILLGNPFAVLIRPGISTVAYFPLSAWFAWLPVFPFPAAGVVGLLALLCLLSPRWATQKSDVWLRAVGYFSLLAGIGLQFGVTGLEIRRHIAMGLALSSAFWILRLFPRLSPQPELRPWRSVALLCFSLCFIAHGYFLYSFMGKPSTLDPNWPWKDYFAVQNFIAEKYPGLPTLVATEPTTENVVLPPLMETTTSFAFGGHVLVHSDLSADAFQVLSRIQNSGDFVPYAERLGYRAIVWGPIEEKIWGEPWRTRFIRKEREMYRSGLVGLYWLDDGLLRRWQTETKNPTPLVTADFLMRQGWCLEAIDTLKDGMRGVADARPYWKKIATCLYYRREYQKLAEVQAATRIESPIEIN